MSAEELMAEILSEMAALVGDYADGAWARAFGRLAQSLYADPEEARQEFKRMYGGMGGLSDIVLCDPQGGLLRKENDRFDELRAKLYRHLQAP